MSILSDLRERVRTLVFRRRAELDLDEELQFHLEQDAQERVRRGADPATTKREALIALGGLERRKEEVRAARGTLALEESIADLRHALRSLRRDPLCASGTVLVLALGIGAASAVYGIADAVLIAELPYPHPDRIVRIYEAYSPANMFGLSVVDVQAIAAQQRSFDSFGALRPGSAALSAGGQPEQRGVGRVTAGFFDVLGARPAAGRLVQPGDESAGAEPVVVASYSFAVQHFGAARAAVGQPLMVDGVSHVVVGVLPEHSADLGGYQAAVWIAMGVTQPPRRGPFGIRAYARLRDGVTLDAAARDLGGISRRIFPLWQSSFRDSTTKLTPLPLRTAMLGDRAERQVGLLGAGVLLVLLVAIVNAAILMLVRVSAREPELSVRSALGAGRVRLVRLLAAESLWIAAAAGAAGFALAGLLLKLAPQVLPGLPRIREVAATWHVGALAALAAATAAGLASVSAIVGMLRRGAAGLIADWRVGSGRRTNRGRSMLVAAEFGLALPLLFGAGLLLNSFLRLQRVDPGYDPDGAVSVAIGLPDARYAEAGDVLRFWDLLEQRMHASPSFAGAGLSAAVPPAEPGDINNFDLKDRPVPSGSAEHVSPWSTVTNGYFETLHIPLLEGRLFSAADSAAAPPVVVVSRSWAQHYYPGESAVGREMISGGCTSCPPTAVIGVVGDVKYLGLAASSDAVYDPVTQRMPSSTNLVARVRGATVTPAAFAAIRDIVASLDPALPVVETTLRAQMDDSLADPRRWTSILGAFSLATVLLASVGIFGLMAYTVRQRRREIGVRMALGAPTSGIVWMVVSSGMRWAIAGSVAGAGVALAGSRWLRAFLFDVGAADAATLASVLLLLLGVAMLACWLAARRAARIHPVEAIAAQ